MRKEIRMAVTLGLLALLQAQPGRVGDRADRDEHVGALDGATVLHLDDDPVGGTAGGRGTGPAHDLHAPGLCSCTEAGGQC